MGAGVNGLEPRHRMLSETDELHNSGRLAAAQDVDLSADGQRVGCQRTRTGRVVERFGRRGSLAHEPGDRANVGDHDDQPNRAVAWAVIL